MIRRRRRRSWRRRAKRRERVGPHRWLRRRVRLVRGVEQVVQIAPTRSHRRGRGCSRRRHRGRAQTSEQIVDARRRRRRRGRGGGVIHRRHRVRRARWRRERHHTRRRRDARYGNVSKNNLWRRVRRRRVVFVVARIRLLSSRRERRRRRARWRHGSAWFHVFVRAIPRFYRMFILISYGTVFRALRALSKSLWCVSPVRPCQLARRRSLLTVRPSIS